MAKFLFYLGIDWRRGRVIFEKSTSGSSSSFLENEKKVNSSSSNRTIVEQQNYDSTSPKNKQYLSQSSSSSLAQQQNLESQSSSFDSIIDRNFDQNESDLEFLKRICPFCEQNRQLIKMLKKNVIQSKEGVQEEEEKEGVQEEETEVEKSSEKSEEEEEDDILFLNVINRELDFHAKGIWLHAYKYSSIPKLEFVDNQNQKDDKEVTSKVDEENEINSPSSLINWSFSTQIPTWALK